jgi:hypothetical protein
VGGLAAAGVGRSAVGELAPPRRRVRSFAVRTGPMGRRTLGTPAEGTVALRPPADGVRALRGFGTVRACANVAFIIAGARLGTRAEGSLAHAGETSLRVGTLGPGVGTLDPETSHDGPHLASARRNPDSSQDCSRALIDLR